MISRSILSSQLGKGLELSLAFLLTVVLSRGLGPERYGDYVLLLGWLSLATLIIGLGLQESLSRHLPGIVAAGYAPQNLLYFTLTIRLLLVFLLAGLALGLRTPLFLWLKQPALAPYLGPMLLLFLFSQIVHLGWSYFIAQFRVGMTIATNLARNLLLIGVTWWWWRQGSLTLELVLQLLVCGYALSALMYLAAAWWQHEPDRPAWPWASSRRIIQFGLPVWGIAFLTFLLADQTDILLLGTLLADSSQVAYYQVGTALVWKLMGVITVGSHMVLTTLTTMQERLGPAGLTQSWQSFIKLSTATVVPLYLFVALFAPQLIALIYGDAFAPSARFLRLFVSLMLLPVGLMGGGLHLLTLYVWERERLALALRLAAGLLNLGLALALIQCWGAIGVVWATGLTVFLGTGLELLAVQRLHRQPYPWAFALKICGAVLAAGLAVGWLPVDSWRGLTVVATAYGLVLLLAFRLLRPLSNSDQQQLSQLDIRLGQVAHWFTAVS